ncbi:MAG: DUF3667 domain-containing protein [Chitinophagaceae bacterium]
MEQCLNCGTELRKDDRFCQKCAQKTDTHRLTLAHFFHEFFHAFTHTDKGILHLLKELALRPGLVAREYVAGKRKKYFNPFTFFLLIMGFFVFTGTVFRKADIAIRPDEQVLLQIPSEEGKKQYIATMGRVENVRNFTNKHGNVIAMVAIPFISLITWCLFRRKGLNYAEHLTANMLFITFSNLLFALIVFPLAAALKGGTGLGMVYLFAFLIQAFYLSWGLNGFLQLKSFGERARSLGISFSGILLWVLLSQVAFAVYIYQSWNFPQYFTRMFRQ